MLLLSLVSPALALPLDFLLADDPLRVIRIEPSLLVASRGRDELFASGSGERCQDAPQAWLARDAVTTELGAASELTRCWLPDVPVEQVLDGATPAAAKGCFVHIHEDGAEYACAEGAGTLLLSVETPASVDEAWLAARFAKRGTLTGSTAEQSFAAWSGPATLWLRLGEAPEAALLSGQARANQAIRYADPAQQVNLWRAGRQESESAILAIDPGRAEISELVAGVRSDHQLVAVADLTPRGEQIWSHFQPARLPAWTGEAHDLRLEVGADLGAMARLVKDPTYNARAARDLMRNCGWICTLTQSFGSPAMTVLTNLGAQDAEDAVGLMALWTLDKGARDLHVVTRSAQGSGGDPSALLKGLGEQIPATYNPKVLRKHGALIFETGESHWGRLTRVAPGLRLTLLDLSDENLTRNRLTGALAHLPMSLEGPLTFELTRRGARLVAVTNGADLQLPDASPAGGQPWTDAEGYRCLRELVEQDPIRRPIDWERRWLPDDTPALVEMSMTRAAACRARSPENERIIANLEAGYRTLLGLYLLEHGRFDDAAAPLQAACTAGEWLACQVSRALPKQGLSVDLLPKAPPDLHAAPAIAPTWTLARGKVSSASGTCEVADRACLAGVLGHTSPLLVVEPTTTVAELARLLSGLESGELAPAAWLAGWDGEHMGARLLTLEQASEIDETVTVAPESAASALLTLDPEHVGLWFRVKGAR